MTSWRTSGSESAGGRSSAFERFHPGVQRWLWRRKWSSLHPIQERAAEPILEGRRDVLICAPTAGGKTEAAYLPLVTRFARDVEEEGRGAVGLLCISPLKALINDQHTRLESLLEAVGSTAHRWHGDVPKSHKDRVLNGAGGLLLITPESLEALFVLRGPRLQGLFSRLLAIVVDELHAFPVSPRGRQLQSLLHRVEVVVGRRLPRIALSATLGDLGRAAEFLRPGSGADVVILEDDADDRALKLQLRGYVRRAPVVEEVAEREAEVEGDTDPGSEKGEEIPSALEIPRHLFRHLRGSDHLVFANTRARVEELADRLRRDCERLRVPNEFLPHHGSLSREIREEAERRLKDPARPATLVCTSTLELGIDVGHVSSVAQVGRPQSVSALRQRLGRSGRRAEDPSILRLYLSEGMLTSQSTLQDALRPSLVETVAVVELMLARWIEPPPRGELHLSTLIQQLLSLVAERGGVQPRTAWRTLCRDGPFRQMDPPRFTSLLRELGRREVLSQASDGDLVLGIKGEGLVGHYTFYAAFQTPEEFLLRHRGKPLGSMPTSNPMVVGGLLIFAGRRWRITGVDPEARVVDLEPASGGLIPVFGQGGLPVHHQVRRKMRRIYEEPTVPRYLDRGARRLLEEGRTTYRSLGLQHRLLLPEGEDTVIFPWIGDKALATLVLHLQSAGIEAVVDGVSARAPRRSPNRLREDLRALLLEGPPDPVELAREVANPYQDKYDPLLPPQLLAEDHAVRALDVERQWGALQALAGSTLG